MVHHLEPEARATAPVLPPLRPLGWSTRATVLLVVLVAVVVAGVLVVARSTHPASQTSPSSSTTTLTGPGPGGALPGRVGFARLAASVGAPGSADLIVVAGGTAARVERLHPHGGVARVLWSTKVTGPVPVQLLVDGATSYVVQSGHLLALSSSSGALRWSAPITTSVSGGVASLLDHRIVVPDAAFDWVAFGAASNRPQWRIPLAAEVLAMRPTGSRPVVVSLAEGAGSPAPTGVATVDPATGRLGAVHVLGCESAGPSLAMDDPLLPVPGSGDLLAVVGSSGREAGCAVRFDPVTGTVRWRALLPRPADDAVAKPINAGGWLVVAGATGGSLTAISVGDGRTTTVSGVTSRSLSPRTVVDGWLVADDQTGNTPADEVRFLGWDLAAPGRQWASSPLAGGGAGGLPADSQGTTPLSGAGGLHVFTFGTDGTVTVLAVDHRTGVETVESVHPSIRGSVEPWGDPNPLVLDDGRSLAWIANEELLVVPRAGAGPAIRLP